MGCWQESSAKHVSSLPILPSSLTALLERAQVTTSFVVDENGEVANSSGNSKGIGNQTDLELLRSMRASSEVVLTSGLTARLEQYRMPRHADLAIFTAQGVSQLDLKPRAGQNLIILSPPIVNSYQESLRALRTRYQNIHVEFGPRGAQSLRKEIDLFVISSTVRIGIHSFLKGLQLQETESFELPELFVTLAVGRG